MPALPSEADVLDVSPCHKVLGRFHQRFLDEETPEAVRPEAFAAFDDGAYSPDELAYGRAAWEMRTLDEYRSQLAFTQLLADLTRVGVTQDILGTAIRVIRDEARHVELCRRLVVALGGDDVIPASPPSPSPATTTCRSPTSPTTSWARSASARSSQCGCSAPSGSAPPARSRRVC